jgi:hypothetical protein
MGNWAVVGTLAHMRLFGVLVEVDGKPQNRWTLSPPLRQIDFEDCRAETADGAGWELLLPLLGWSEEARSALRSVASLAGLNIGNLDANALVRPGEDLGGVSDQIWIQTHAIARALKIRPPRRDLASVRSFNALHGPTFLSNRHELVRNIGRPKKVDRSSLEVPEFHEAGVRARVLADFRNNSRPTRRVLE